MRLVLRTLALLVCLAEPAMAAPRCSGDELWELATQTLDRSAGEVTIAVVSEGRFKALWYKAQGSPIATTTLRVESPDSAPLMPNEDRVVQTGAWSDPIILPGATPRPVTSLTLRYKIMRTDATSATLQIWGQQTVALPSPKC